MLTLSLNLGLCVTTMPMPIIYNVIGLSYDTVIVVGL